MRPKYVGMRTIKTAIAVVLAVYLSQIIGSNYPIFMVIAAIVAMNRTITGSFQSAKDLMIGNAFGASMGLLFALFFPETRAILMGVGIILIIHFCNRLKISNAIPLSCIVFSSICLNMGTSDPMIYSINRLVDTFIGLIIAIIINVVFKPYNNLPKIRKKIRLIQKCFEPFIDERVLHNRIPELDVLQEDFKELDDEILMYENEWFGRQKRKGEAAHLRGCQQLLVKMFDELSAICSMDSTPLPSKENLLRMQKIGFQIPDEMPITCMCSDEDNIVLNFHLKNLLDANNFLTELMTL